jgi:hypothetical protein
MAAAALLKERRRTLSSMVGPTSYGQLNEEQESNSFEMSCSCAASLLLICFQLRLLAQLLWRLTPAMKLRRLQPLS